MILSVELSSNPEYTEYGGKKDEGGLEALPGTYCSRRTTPYYVVARIYEGEDFSPDSFPLSDYSFRDSACVCMY